MEVLGIIAPIVTNPVTIGSVVGLLFFWAAWSGISFWIGCAKLQRAFKSAHARLCQNSNPLAFATDFESISANLEKTAYIGKRWEEYRETLILRQAPQLIVLSTLRASDFFNLSLFRVRKVGIDLRYHAVLPNLLVGAGLLFTFLGLAAALHSAGGIVSGTSEERNIALKSLLDSASFKFITSLVGLALSILYTVYRKAILSGIDRTIDQFVSVLESLAPMVTPARLQSDTNEILTRQSSVLESFSNDLALSIGSAFDQAFDKRLGEHIAPLTEAMQALAERMQSSNEGALKTMLDGFVDKLQGGAGGHMEKVATSLSGLGERLEGLQSGLGDAAVRMSQSADAMAIRMGKGAEEALRGITDQLGGLADSLKAMADQTRAAGDDAGRELAARLEAAAGGFERSASGIADTLSSAATSLAASMGKQSEESSTRLASQVEAMADRIAGSASGFEQMAERVAAALEKSASDTGGALGKGAEDAVGRIATATEGMRTELQTMLGEFRATLGRAGEDLSAGAAAGAASFRDGLGDAGSGLAVSIAGAADRLAEAGNATAEALERGGAAASESIGRAGNGFGDRASALSNQVERVSQTTQLVNAQMLEFENAVRGAATPLTAVSVDLKSASQAARASLEPVAQASQAIARSLDQMNGATQRLEAAGVSASRLVESLNGAAQRFEGVDRDLAKTLEALQAGLRNFTTDISTAVQQTDSNLATAVGRLNSLLRDLNDVVEDMPAAVKAYATGG